MSFISLARRSALAALVAGVAARSAHAQGFKVIANASVSEQSLSRSQLSRIFLKQESKFPGGQFAVPVDLPTASPIREAFSQNVLGRSVGPVKTFWQQQIFAGRSAPPVQKPADAEIVAFVSSTPGAIGYVSPAASVGGGVKLINVGP